MSTAMYQSMTQQQPHHPQQQQPAADATVGAPVFSQLICNACDFAITTAHQRTEHYRSEWHRYNVKRRVAGLQPINAIQFDSQLALLQQRKNAQTSRDTKTKTKCTLCHKTFASDAAYNAHLGTKKHIRAIKDAELKQANGEDVEGEDDVDQSEDDDVAEQVDVNVAAAHASTSPAAPVATQPNNTGISGALAALNLHTSQQKFVTTADDDKHDDEKAADDDEDDMDEDELDMTNAIPAHDGACLFCSQEFDTVELLLPHMQRQHGFFLPFSDYLTNLTAGPDSDSPGLLTYLGAKIGAGNTCIWCNKRYSSTQAVRNHMYEKGHCKIKLDDEDDEEEYAPFYTFAEEGEDMEQEASASSSALVTVDSQPQPVKQRRGLSHINDYDELVLKDGTTIGHRSLQRIYNMKYHTPSTAVATTGNPLLSQIRSEYAAQQLTPYSAGMSNNAHALQQQMTKTERREAAKAAELPSRRAMRMKMRELLYVGMANNNQKHFRAQMMV